MYYNNSRVILGKKDVIELGKLPLLLKALEDSKKITKFGLDFESKIEKSELDKIMETLSKKHSSNLLALSLGNNKTLIKILDCALSNKIDGNFGQKLESFHNLLELDLSIQYTYNVI